MIRNHPILNRKLTIQSTAGVFFTADTYTGAAPKDSVEVPEHALEVGSKISDHAHLNPSEFSVTVLLAGSPLPEDERASGPTAHIDKYGVLLVMLRDRALCTVTWGLRVMSNMLLVSVEPTVENTNKAAVALQFKEIALATQRLVTVSEEELSDSAKRGGATGSKKGRQPSRTATRDDEAKRKADEKWKADKEAAEEQDRKVREELETSGDDGAPPPLRSKVSLPSRLTTYSDKEGERRGDRAAVFGCG